MPPFMRIVTVKSNQVPDRKAKLATRSELR
jgi:hypothetical protein